MPIVQRISPCLWFNDQAEEAAAFYTAIFSNSRVTGRHLYTEVGRELHGKEPGSVMTVSFELDGLPFTALNGGPMFQFSEALSLQVLCETQDEVDYYWERLLDGGVVMACGWLKDRYGVSWQVVPTIIQDLLADPDVDRVRRVTEAIFAMKKLDIPTLLKAAE